MQRRTIGILVIAVVFTACFVAVGAICEKERTDVSPAYPVRMHDNDLYGTVTIGEDTYNIVESDAYLYMNFEKDGLRGYSLYANIVPYYNEDMYGFTESYRYVSTSDGFIPIGAEPIEDGTGQYAYDDPVTGNTLTFSMEHGVIYIDFSGRDMFRGQFVEFDVEAGFIYYPQYVENPMGPMPDPYSGTISGEENGIPMTGKVTLTPICSVKSIDGGGRSSGIYDYYHIVVDIEGSGIPRHMLDRYSSVWIDEDFTSTDSENYLNGNTYTRMEYRFYIDGDQLVFEGSVTTETLDDGCETVSEETLEFSYRGTVG